MSKNYYVIDFETYYDSEYSLRRMTPVEYILDPRFECIGASILQGDDGVPAFYEEDEIRHWLRSLNPKTSVVVSHNALFDMSILHWRFGFLPGLMIDTLGMSRALVYHQTGSASLEKVAYHLGLPPKTNTIKSVTGMGKEAIKAAGLWPAYTQYANNDADIARLIFMKLREEFPREEFIINDMVIRCAVQPRFVLDRNVLAEHLHAVKEGKRALLDRAGLSNRDDLMSNEKFAQALRQLGVEPPTKTSLRTGQITYAFAKTDQGMADLEEHDDAQVQALVAARLGLKTTIEETRTEKLLRISNLTWPGKGEAALMPIPLRYSGAHTHRLSGDWKLNTQNLPRGGALRRAFTAPEGYSVVTCDSAQVEARMVAWLAGERPLVKAFAEGRDVYSEFASGIFGYEVKKKTHIKERFIGKTSILGLGFSMGAPKFEVSVATQSRLQLGEQIDLGLDEATRIVHLYRNTYPMIPRLWKILNNLIPIMQLRETNAALGPCRVLHESVLLPNGLKLRYSGLRKELTQAGSQFVYTFGRETQKLYGGKFCENIVQALARIVVMRAAIKMKALYPDYPLAMQVHDELVYIVPTPLVPEFRKTLREQMSIAADEFEGLPLAAEDESGPNYGEAKP